ncbi:MFS multidrug transporter [Arthroderma uncinatum]|uniref:MFS multidrug transporter n=1 Tax=Arthroderma uncinatum TaxID=74035 RepID=UPI00144A5E5D|nr:MFS multidrug transporter [Arthroderma uncinatum]KAF3491755.1 MFS multidrug transporter [Arthroderma uncinatum]
MAAEKQDPTGCSSQMDPTPEGSTQPSIATIPDTKKFAPVASEKESQTTIEAAEQEGPTDPEAAIQLTRTNSYIPPVIVPRGKRRGLFGSLTLLAEVENPKLYNRKAKWFITFVVAIAAAAAPMGSAIFLPGLSEVANTFNTTATVTNLSVALYMLSISIFPLWWSSFSERLGRRSIYLASFALFTLWSILSAISVSITMLIIMRVLAGGAAASVQAVGAGTIADIWDPVDRGRAMGIFYLGPLCGPLIAPILGGIFTQAWGWRSTQWFLTIYGGLVLVFILFALPETLAIRKPLPPAEPETQESAAERTLSRVSSRQVVQQTTRLLNIFKIVIIDPLKIILYIRFPAVALTVYYASIAFGCLYVMNISIEVTFSRDPYNFSTLIVGLLYVPSALGYIVASLGGGPWMDSIMKREARRANRVDANGRYIFIPEDRMRENAWLGALIFPSALIWYGWTSENGVHWFPTILANFFFGLGSMIIFSMSTTMLTEFMPNRSSAGVALNNFMRNIASCVGGIVAAPIIDAIGNGWLFTILGLVCFASCICIWAMKRFGPRWRVTMDEQLKKENERHR